MFSLVALLILKMSSDSNISSSDFEFRGRRFRRHANGEISVDMIEHTAGLETAAVPRAAREAA